MSELTFSASTNTSASASIGDKKPTRSLLRWPNRSNTPLLSSIHSLFEHHKEAPKPSHFYRFYWICCRHPRGIADSTASLQSKPNIAPQNYLLNSSCRKCGHKICDSCERIALPETPDATDSEQGGLTRSTSTNGRSLATDISREAISEVEEEEVVVARSSLSAT